MLCDKALVGEDCPEEQIGPIRLDVVDLRIVVALWLVVCITTTVTVIII